MKPESWGITLTAARPPVLRVDAALSGVGAVTRKLRRTADTTLESVSAYRGQRIEAALLFLGITLRTVPFLFHRSLWHDEALLALNIINRRLPELARPLQFHQQAPLGFLALERFTVEIFGTSEFALRLVPLVAGIAALFLFRKLAHRYLEEDRAAWIALALFAVSAPLNYYSSEVKQYSLDVLVAIVLTLAALRVIRTGFSRAATGSLAVAGAVAVWLTHPSFFILPAIGAVLFGTAYRRQDQAGVRRLVPVALSWGVSGALCYFLVIRASAADPLPALIWADAFPPSPLHPITLIGWAVNRFFGMFDLPVGIPPVGLGALCFLVGWGLGLRQRFAQTLLLLGPAVVLLGAAAAHRYPVEGRFLLFLVPAWILITANGAYFILKATWRQSRLVGVTILSLLFVNQLVSIPTALRRPVWHEELRPVFQELGRVMTAGQSVYLYPRGEPAFRYYLQQARPAPAALQAGVHLRDELQRELDRPESEPAQLAHLEEELRGLRGEAWIVFTHVRDGEEDLLVDFLDRLGKRRTVIRATGASAYLYDLPQEKQQP